MSVISMKKISKNYEMGEAMVHALREIDLEVDPGEFLAIVGPSGSGKSTLMNLIGCLDRPSQGEYRLDGEEVSTLNDDELAHIRNKKIGFVFQTFNLLPRTNCLHNVELPLLYSNVPRRERERKALELLNQVGLADRVYHNPNELSGGERQRVAIARALINDPAIVLADEPTGNLDSKTGSEIMSIFTELNKEGKTVVLVTHERYIADYSRRIITLKDGRVVSEDTSVLR
ncbi:MAG TPA: ABC transporter ATP-binding protein [bacterium]|nr:ABC transporter ATP-binding protein [bacterium]